MNKHKPLIIFAAILLLIVVSCSRNTSDALYKADIKAAQEWWQNSKQKLAKKNMRIPLQNGEILMGSISWQKAYSYTWRGNEYIEVPYVFNGVEKIIQGTDTTSYSLVLRVLNKDYFVGAISTTQTSSAPILGMDSSALINTRTYTLLDGTEANTWLNDGSRLKSIKSVSRSEKEIAALDALIKEARKNKKEGNTTVRKAINPIEEEEICETYTYSEISPSSGNIDYYGDGSYDFVDTLNKDLENVTINGYIKQKTVSYCFTEIKRDGFPPPPMVGGGGGDFTNNEKNLEPVDFANLCGVYKYKIVGEARYATIGPIGFTLVNSDGRMLPVIFDRVCFGISLNFASRESAASEIINDAWNFALINVKGKANLGVVAQPKIMENMKKDINLYLKKFGNGSSFKTTECDGNIPISKPKYCSN